MLTIKRRPKEKIVIIISGEVVGYIEVSETKNFEVTLNFDAERWVGLKRTEILTPEEQEQWDEKYGNRQARLEDSGTLSVNDIEFT